MKLLLIIAAFLGFAVLAREADAQETSKPVVCVSYRVIDAKLAVCSDSKKPFLVRSFDEMTSVRPDGVKVSVLVGWR